MKFNTLKPELYVSNFQKSLDFYTNLLGFKLEYQRINPLFAFLSYQESQMMIQQQIENENWYNGIPEYPYGRGVNFQIRTGDVMHIVKNLEKNNYPIIRGIKESWYRENDILHGCLEILVIDPDGYLLRFSQSLGEKLAI
jgi:catechol 2,3-dioxygenase-like lactoylglutathione lyase family enzyme